MDIWGRWFYLDLWRWLIFYSLTMTEDGARCLAFMLLFSMPTLPPFQGKDVSNSIHNWLNHNQLCWKNVEFTTASRFCFVSLYSSQNGLLVGSSWQEALCSRIPGEFSSWWKIYLWCIVNGWKAVSCFQSLSFTILATLLWPGTCDKRLCAPKLE